MAMDKYLFRLDCFRDEHDKEPSKTYYRRETKISTYIEAQEIASSGFYRVEVFRAEPTEPSKYQRVQIFFQHNSPYPPCEI